jgi:hypothetical protein
VTAVSGHSSPVPRKPSLARMLGRDHRRIRRIEVNRQNGMPPVVCGTALYATNVTAYPAAAAWTPGADALEAFTDSIGCTPGGGHLGIPKGWFWWATVNLTLKTDAPPAAGDFLAWSAASGSMGADYRQAPLTDSSGAAPAQVFTAQPNGAAGTLADVVEIPEVASALGTLFVVSTLEIFVTALSPFACGGYIAGPS